MIKDSLRIIGDLVENVLDEITQTKTLCFNCVKEYLDIALWLFPIFVGDPAVCEELFAFFHTVFDVLKVGNNASVVSIVARLVIEDIRIRKQTFMIDPPSQGSFKLGDT